MVRIFRHYVSPVKLALALTDTFGVLGAVFLAEWARYTALGLDAGSVAWPAIVAKIMVPFVMIPALLSVGGYHSDAIRDNRVFIVRLFLALLLTSISLAAFLYLLPMLPLWRSILVLTMLFSGIVILGIHWAFLSFGGSDFLSHRVLILGAGEKSLELKKFAETTPEAGLNIIGTVQMPGQKSFVEDAVELDDINHLDSFAHSKHAELILIADTASEDLPLEALIACKLTGIEIKDRLSFLEQVRGYVDLSSVQAEWIIFSDGFRGGTALELATKRTLDVAISLLTLILTSPILLLAAVAVRLTSRGPIFYRQERTGLHGKPFGLLKFRSMVVNAEKEGHPEWAKKSDPRITLVGGFLRRSRIDELPQIVNVLKGNMSFVGPRPERPYFVTQLEKDIPFYRERHCLKPGITGWAQIRYPYGASFEDSRRKLEYDLYYIKNYSVFLDILIILQTLRVVLFPVGVR